jgi:CubicO group peptidase (beta-lactamase class C family)
MTAVNGFDEAWRSSMDDWNGPDLSPLMTAVDHPEARALFERRRTRRRRQRVGLHVTAVAVLVVLVVAGVSALRSREDDVPLRSGSTEDEPTAGHRETPAFPPQPDGVPWPTEDWTEGEWPEGVDRAVVDAATDTALAGGAAERVRAVVIVHRGAIVYERYSPNREDGPNEVMPSYSMAKSVLSAMIGILVRDERLDIHGPAAVPEWHEDPDDPRATITVEHMLHMATGMEWDDGDYADEGTMMYELVRSDDAAAYAASQQPTAEPGTSFDYNNGTSVVLARILGDEVGGDADDVRAFLDAELFDKIGMDPVHTDFDQAGTWLGAYSADSTARDFARFGLLYLRGGEWDGEQILPEGWVEYTRTPSPAEPEYGAHWWLDLERPGVSYAVGVRGQAITVDPAHDLVIVQLSTVGGSLPLDQTEAILDAFAAAEG